MHPTDENFVEAALNMSEAIYDLAQRSKEVAILGTVGFNQLYTYDLNDYYQIARNVLQDSLRHEKVEFRYSDNNGIEFRLTFENGHSGIFQIINYR